MTDFPATKNDDDVTKQKRIEHITKLLKTDLIESFKSVPSVSPSNSISPNYRQNVNSNKTDDSIELILSPYTNTSKSGTAQNSSHLALQPQMQQQYSNPNSDVNYQILSGVDDENFLMNDLNLAVDLEQDNNVPNLTIEPSSCSSLFPQQQKLPFQAGRQQSSSSLTLGSFGPKLDEASSNDDFSPQQQQQAHSSFRRNSQNTITFGNAGSNSSNDQSNVRKKLQERLQRNTTVTGNVSSSCLATNISQQPHINPNVAVVSPVVSTLNQNVSYSNSQLGYPTSQQEPSLSKKILTEAPIYQSQPSKMTPPVAQIAQQKMINNKYITNGPMMTPGPVAMQQQQQQQQQQPHLATTTTTVTVTTQHYPVSDQNLSNPSMPTSLSTQISMHAMSPNPLVSQRVSLIN